MDHFNIIYNEDLVDAFIYDLGNTPYDVGGAFTRTHYPATIAKSFSRAVAKLYHGLKIVFNDAEISIAVGQLNARCRAGDTKIYPTWAEILAEIANERAVVNEKPTPRIVFSDDDTQVVFAKITSNRGPWISLAVEILDYAALIADEQLAAQEKPVFEVGKRYRTVGGDVAGPLRESTGTFGFSLLGKLNGLEDTTWTGDGFYYLSKCKMDANLVPGAIEGEPAPAPIPAAESKQVPADAPTHSLNDAKAWKENFIIAQVALTKAESQLSELRARCERAEARIEKFRGMAERDLALYQLRGSSIATTYKSTLESVCHTLGLTVLPAVPSQPLRVIKAEDE